MFYSMNKTTYKMTSATKKSMLHHDNFRQSHIYLYIVKRRTNINMNNKIPLLQLEVCFQSN